MNKIIVICLFIIAVLSISAVSANENITETAQISDDAQDIITESSPSKEDLNVSIEFRDYVLNPDYSERMNIATFSNVPEDYDGKVNVKIDDENYLMSHDPHNDVDFTKIEFSNGKHSIKAYFPETDKYNPLNLTHDFEVASQYIRITKEANPDEGYVYCELQRYASGYLIVKVDGKEFKRVEITTDDNAYARVNLKGLAIGTHTVEATYTGDAKNNKMTKKETVTIKKIMKEIRINHNYRVDFYENQQMRIAYGNEKILEISLSDDSTNRPIVKSGAKTYSLVNDYGQHYTTDISDLMIGSNIFEITYPGDDKYLPKTVSYTIEVKGHIFTNIGVYNSTYAYLKLPKNAEGNLSVYVNDSLYKSQSMADGFANITFEDLKDGNTYKIDIIYTGNDYNVSAYSTTQSIIPKLIYDECVRYGSDAKFSFEMNPDRDGFITVKIERYKKDNETYTLPLVNGKANATISDLQLPVPIKNTEFYENNRVTLTYSSEEYNYTTTFLVVAEPIPAKIVNAKDITMYYGESKVYSVKVYDYDGKIAAKKSVYFEIGYNFYWAKTDEKGVAKVTFKETPGKYTLKITYSRKDLYDYENFYKYAVVTKKLIVKQPLSLKTVAVKKSAKKLTLQATLKYGKKAIKNKKITFKFNGKTYKAKTDKKGIAKVTIKSSVLKKLKVGKKITYQATYLKDTVQKTVKVQR
ncbi:MAG: Ig-like domain repeat protein [Methanobrevibacter sp.]|uniref:Ig-like domain-containing protein n=1 Tax=Methanobrevibacter sp. TaxID=66852 RepID=UPI0025D726A5|nr:Ig-like domain-containing protein [Methanobrevibacter sp.]MBE6497269.1 Ig-like domain repeat protein [Methanobrevibacter sp.]